MKKVSPRTPWHETGTTELLKGHILETLCDTNPRKMMYFAIILDYNLSSDVLSVLDYQKAMSVNVSFKCYLINCMQGKSRLDDPTD